MSLIFSKSYYDYSMKDICLLMMVKDEEKSILKSLNSVKDVVSLICIFDTGSTDTTVQKIIDFSNDNKLNTIILQGEFVDFSTSRNVLFDYVDNIDIPYLLLLDANDELKGGDILKREADKYLNSEETGFLVRQHWWHGKDVHYHNVRFLKNKNGWRYKGKVHEWIFNEKHKDKIADWKLDDKVVIFQDRTQNTESSYRRFFRDKELLLKDHEENKEDARTLFYLSQTCECLGEYENAILYSKKRLEVVGFYEEIFHSYMRCGDCYMKLTDYDNAVLNYMKAYQHFNRVEPLVKLADYYKFIKSWHTAYMYSMQSVLIPYPTECTLFVDRGMYDYDRWKLLADICLMVNKNYEGLKAIQKCIETRDLEEDKKVLKMFQKLVNKK